MVVETVFTVGAISRARKGLALGHAPQVVFVEVFAFEALFAQALEEMFTDQRAVCHRGRETRRIGR
jgi:hypothetical protein